MAIKTQSLLLFFALTASSSVHEQNKVYESPRAGMRAVVIPVGRKGFEGQESRIEIRTEAGKTVRWKSFVSSDGEHGRIVHLAMWTPDGQFFVFNAPSSGGHQPWNVATYFYSRRTNRFYLLDDYVGPVTSDFVLVGRSTLKATRFNFDKREEKEFVTVNLHRLLSITRSRR
jgi:hypothetical protein